MQIKKSQPELPIDVIQWLCAQAITSEIFNKIWLTKCFGKENAIKIIELSEEYFNSFTNNDVS
jgi:hypothetical protein